MHMKHDAPTMHDDQQQGTPYLRMACKLRQVNNKSILRGVNYLTKQDLSGHSELLEGTNVPSIRRSLAAFFVEAEYLAPPASGSRKA